MKLLILTQKVDINDDVLGFFHGWIREFAKHCEKITVICLQKGEYDLSENVKVLSLGKEEYLGHSGVIRKFVSLYRFYKYIWQERKNYDVVFVHMNQEYVLLGGLFWRLMGKKVMLWRNHPAGSFMARIAVLLSDKVFCTSKQSFTARFKKTEIMPVGIDTELFRRKPEIERDEKLILFLGRMSRIKKPDLLIRALDILNKQNVDFKALFVGDPLTADDQKYYKELDGLVSQLGLENKIEFSAAVSNTKTVDYYNKCGLFVNLTPSGSMDKTIFEAMACECPVLVSNLNLRGLIGDDFFVNENAKDDLTEKIKVLLSLSVEKKNNYGKELRNFVLVNHSLDNLIGRFLNG